MSTNGLKVLLIAILFSQCATESSQQAKNDNPIKRQIILFDGKSADAWKDIKSDNFPEHGWIVKDGVLTVEATTPEHEGGHDIVTKEQFSSFELELEVRLSEGANSGIKYMVIDSYPGSEGQYLGLEYQLIDNEKHPDALLGRNGNRKMAALYDVLPARENILINPPGEWNKVKIVVDGNRVEHWLNAKLVLAYIRGSDSYKELVLLSKYYKLKNFGEQEKGHILLQGHGNEVSFRNIRITTG
ncbi:MAG TPA: DUF1080 domain-containing protein [Bacteroidales bacterium]|nr:DUF1080 domain-containing protein [Bacteroidales bacterium]